MYVHVYEKSTVQFTSVGLAQALPNEHAYTHAVFLDLFYQPLVRSSDQSISAELSKITAELVEIDGKRANNMSEVRRIEERVKRLGTEVTQKVRRVRDGRSVWVGGVCGWEEGEGGRCVRMGRVCGWEVCEDGRSVRVLMCAHSSSTKI